ncbi:hypothetical protein AAHA92_17043 [Salvia divinorum]|uniref:Uncharacterized protein n=1 Tax=Salvia divinorum TaxID=28513 RepID=A0ABD1GXH1_SALDI
MESLSPSCSGAAPSFSVRRRGHRLTTLPPRVVVLSLLSSSISAVARRRAVAVVHGFKFILGRKECSQGKVVHDHTWLKTWFKEELYYPMGMDFLLNGYRECKTL